MDTPLENRLWLDKLKEVVDLAQPDILWQDVDLDKIDEARRLDFLAYYYNRAEEWDREVVATYKDGFDTDNGLVYGYERGGPADLTQNARPRCAVARVGWRRDDPQG